MWNGAVVGESRIDPNGGYGVHSDSPIQFTFYRSKCKEETKNKRESRKSAEKRQEKEKVAAEKVEKVEKAKRLRKEAQQSLADAAALDDVLTRVDKSKKNKNGVGRSSFASGQEGDLDSGSAGAKGTQSKKEGGRTEQHILIKGSESKVSLYSVRVCLEDLFSANARHLYLSVSASLKKI